MLRTSLIIVVLLAWLTMECFAQTLPLPSRALDSISASNLINKIKSLPLNEREDTLASQILNGNVPSALRAFYPLNLTNISNHATNIATVFVARDYLSIGTDDDHFYTPLTPGAAQRIADQLDCTLPTRKIVNAIFATADIKLAPQPIRPSKAMTTVPVFAAHNEIIRTQLVALGKSSLSNALIAGHKKDVVVSARLASLDNKVAIYGWHQTNGVPIQPLYTGHSAEWADYSHGIRLVQQGMILNGEFTTVTKVLADPRLAELLSDEGVITNARYAIHTSSANSFTNSSNFVERTTTFRIEPEIKIHINIPAAESFAADKPVELVLFALPNGNTTAQTIGKPIQPGDDWHYDIQHIGAQTRFLRAAITNRTVAIAYLETEMKSWPAWRRKHGDTLIPAVVERIKTFFTNQKLELALTGHSGGGSFTFGYLNATEAIPADVKRIAFLDSNYAYETTNHFDKLNSWLKSSSENNLTVLAYHDSFALLNGKAFVSERGGTWGRSYAMLDDMQKQFTFTSRTNVDGLETHTALGGRIQFLLKQNPDRRVLHTVQVERNGFIHAMLTATPQENIGYEYFGERAYGKWIHSEH